MKAEEKRMKDEEEDTEKGNGKSGRGDTEKGRHGDVKGKRPASSLASFFARLIDMAS
jgi:hypothetical protein